MPGESFLVAGLIVVTVVLMGALAVLSLTGTSLQALPRELGVLVRLACPEIHQPAQVRIGKDPRSGELAVLWCERFAAGPMACDRACFTAISDPWARRDARSGRGPGSPAA
jgi:hypothetical protein